MNSFQEKYVHRDIIIENNDKHLYIDLDKKIKQLKENWRDKEAFYGILREIDYQIIGEDIYPEQEQFTNYEEPNPKNFQTGLNNRGNFSNNINSNNMSFISNDNSKINNFKLNSSFQRDESFIGNNNINPNNQRTILSPRLKDNVNIEYENEKIKQVISSGRRYPHFPNNDNPVESKTNLFQRKNSIGLAAIQKPYQKRYTDVHANSKLHYLHNIDNDEKHLIEPSQWNDRTNRYFYLREQSPPIPKNYQNTNFNFPNQNELSYMRDNRANNDLIKKVSDMNITNQNYPNFNRNMNDGISNKRFNSEFNKINSNYKLF